MKNFLYLFSLLVSISGTMQAQGTLNLPETSQSATVSQRIGLTDINITYHSPLVKGRVIWGELVPFGEVWRAGANENTTISFSTDVNINGKKLPAGKYGLFMIPRKDSWTIVFSKNSSSWGNYFYNKDEDALRVETNPESSSMQEWLSYRFTDLKASSVQVLMNWEKIGAGFLIEINVPETVVLSMKEELRGVKGFDWSSYWQAADYCSRNKIYTEDAIKWIDKSISIKENFHNLNTKAELIEAKNMNKEAQQLRTRAVNIATEEELNAYGYQLMGSNKLDAAAEVFKTNVNKNPESWNTYDSLAEALEAKGDYKGALVNYKLALKKAPDLQHNRIQTTIQKLEKKAK